MKILFTFLVGAFIALQVFAQSPQEFNYQAIARNLNGNPIANKNIFIEFNILEKTINGAIIYTETHQVNTNSFGLFTLSIGSGNATKGNFSQINWGSGNKFLQVSIDGELQGTTQLLSVPYALYAENTNLKAGDGIEIKDHVISNTNKNEWIKNNNSLSYNNGNVGLRTTNPKGLFELNGSQFADANSVLRIGDPAVGAHHLSSKRDMVFNADSLGIINSQVKGRAFTFRINDFDHQKESRSVMVMSLNGNVGIGDFDLPYNTLNPVAKLQIQDGDIYLQDVKSGVIMTAPNGTCYRLSVDNNGTIKSNKIACPINNK